MQKARALKKPGNFRSRWIEWGSQELIVDGFDVQERKGNDEGQEDRRHEPGCFRSEEH